VQKRQSSILIFSIISKFHKAHFSVHGFIKIISKRKALFSWRFFLFSVKKFTRLNEKKFFFSLSALNGSLFFLASH